MALCHQQAQQSFYDQNPDEVVPSTAELETKEVWEFPVSADAFQAKMGLNYALEIVLKTLHVEGFNVSEREAKNLLSDYFDTANRALNKLGISLRLRYNERSKKEDYPVSEKFQRADLSFKMPANINDPFNTENRGEWEAETEIIFDENGIPQFVLTFEHLINKYVAQILEETGDVKQAVDWARQVYEIFGGFDWSQFQEHFSINCKRSQPYVTLYSIQDIEGNLIKDDGQVVVQKNKPSSLPDGYEVRELVYQFCLDTNRFFTEDPKGSRHFVKIATDYEVEFELQQRSDDYTPDALSSTEGVTYGEANAARALLKDLLYRVRQEYNIKLDKLSGKSKQYRGFIHVDNHYSERGQDNVIAPQFGVRGRKDMVVVKAYSWKEMEDHCPALKEALRAEKEGCKPYLQFIRTAA